MLQILYVVYPTLGWRRAGSLPVLAGAQMAASVSVCFVWTRWISNHETRQRHRLPIPSTCQYGQVLSLCVPLHDGTASSHTRFASDTCSNSFLLPSRSTRGSPSILSLFRPCPASRQVCAVLRPPGAAIAAPRVTVVSRHPFSPWASAYSLNEHTYGWLAGRLARTRHLYHACARGLFRLRKDCGSGFLPSYFCCRPKIKDADATASHAHTQRGLFNFK